VIRRRRVAQAVAATLACALTASGCGPGLQSLGIGRSVPGDSYPLTVVFTDATGLPVGGHVELHNVTVGRVQSLETKDFKAYVHVRISSKVKLPVGTTADLALTTPLGEEYIDLMPPASTGGQVLSADDLITADHTTRSPDVENLLGAFSAVLNGGGIEQIHTIIGQLNKALTGKAAAGRSLIANINTVLAQLSDHTTQIDATLESINTVSKQFASQRQLINRALTQLSPGINDLSADTAAFTTLLTHLSRLGRTATSVLNQVQGTLIADLRGLAPTLDTLVLLRPGLRGVVTGLRRFAILLDRAIPGDFLNLNGSIVPSQP
jgi:phospholipid/cholesterol/gamma-HCH transport system substrate-binding protein